MKIHKHGKHIKTINTVIESCLIVILIVLVAIMMVLIGKLQGTARVINYTGLVRGATQREVKLEITGNPNDELINYLDGILEDLKYKDGDYNLIKLDNNDYEKKLDTQTAFWILLKDEIYKVREYGYENTDIVNLSEEYFQLADLTVSAAEIQDILKAGVHPLLRQTPFQNPQTGNFDKDMLNKFLVEYAKMSESQMPAQYAEQYNNMYKYWSFIQKTLIESRLAEKYQALVSKALLSNPVEAQDAFDARVNQYNVLMAGIPYSSVVDSTIVVKESELKDLYNKKKEQFKQYQETRDIKYIDV